MIFTSNLRPISRPICACGRTRYVTLIVQNLLETRAIYLPEEAFASRRVRKDYVILSVENTGRPIPAAARDIFSSASSRRMGENVAGHGLG